MDHEARDGVAEETVGFIKILHLQFTTSGGISRLNSRVSIRTEYIQRRLESTR